MKNHKGPSLIGYADSMRREDLLSMVEELRASAYVATFQDVSKEIKKRSYKKQLSDLLAFSVDKIAK